MNDKRSVFSGLFWKFSERIFAQGVSFVVSIVLARLLMPENYGTVAMVNVFITIADVFVVSGFSTALIQKKDADDTDFSTILYCSLLVAVVIYIILFVSAPFIADFYNTPILCNVIRVFSLRMPLAAYFAEKNTLTVRSMHEILTMISETDRNSFSIEKASNYYTKYQERYVDDHEAVNRLKEKITGRSILILAPGSSLVKEQDKIKADIRTNNPIVFGVNKISQEYEYDYLYLANEKRVSSLPTEKVKEYITTSNLDFSEGIRVNYASYLCDDADISDDPTLMLINLLMSIGIITITIGGYDGFSANPDENYFDTRMSLGSNIESKMKKNDLIHKQVLKLKQQIDLDFLTDTLYL